VQAAPAPEVRGVAMTIRDALLVLSDGEVFEGEAVGADVHVSSGEVVFNTVLSGYQEVITDPSYAGQIITFTCPHIGNHGTNSADDESRRPHCRGVIVRELARRPSSWRAEETLDDFLRRHSTPGIAGIDTRRLTRHIRDAGAMPGAFGTATEAELLAAARAERGTSGVDLVSQVTTRGSYTVGGGPRRVVAYDLGVKSTMLRHLGEIATVTVVPADTAADEVMALEPDGVFLSNGPGDPERAGAVVEEVRDLIGRVPIFGICLGHQVLSLALGGRTFKMRFGHHGGNVPVRDTRTGKIEITSQNHNFAVEAGSVPGVTETHVCLNDGALEGMVVDDAPAFSVQYHPEAGPGPHDSRYLFAEFAALMDSHEAGNEPRSKRAHQPQRPG
jgi:carbamoyl-phosphate synthase small subunit